MRLQSLNELNGYRRMALLRESLLPELCAYEIAWDTDDQEAWLPRVMPIPAWLSREDDSLSDYVSEQTGFCHNGFMVGLLFRGLPVPCTFACDGDNYEFTFDVKGETARGTLDYTVTIVGSTCVSVFIDRECTRYKLSELVDAEQYLSVRELLHITQLCRDMLIADSLQTKVVSESLEIDKMLLLSSKHISMETANILDKEIAGENTEWENLPPVFGKDGFGWFIYCGDSENCKCPEDLKYAMDFTVDCGCTWLCLDAEGGTVASLAIYAHK